MAAIADLSDLLQLITGAPGANPEVLTIFKSSRIAGVADAAPIIGRIESWWRKDGNPGANAALPGAVSAPDRTHVNAIGQTNAAGGKEKWLVGAWAYSRCRGVFILYDRLLHMSGLSGVVITPQAVGGAITRNTGGLGNRIWVEVYTQIGTTVTTISAAYVNEAGAAKTTPLSTFGGTGFREASRILELPLATGDKGVRSVTSVTVTASTLTAGDFGVTLARPIIEMGCPDSGMPGYYSPVFGMPRGVAIPDNASLAWARLAGEVTDVTGSYLGLSFVDK